MPCSLQTSPGETAALRWRSVEQPVQSETNHPSALSHHVRPVLLIVTILPDEFNSCTIKSYNPLTLLHHTVQYFLQVLSAATCNGMQLFKKQNILCNYYLYWPDFSQLALHHNDLFFLFYLKSIHISDINNNDNNLFYIAPQQQLYELLALCRSTNAIKHINMLLKLA